MNELVNEWTFNVWTPRSKYNTPYFKLHLRLLSNNFTSKPCGVTLLKPVNKLLIGSGLRCVHLYTIEPIYWRVSYNKMKLSVFYASTRSIVRFYEVLACVTKANNLPDSFTIVMKVKSKECYTLNVYITRNIAVAISSQYSIFQNTYQVENV